MVTLRLLLSPRLKLCAHDWVDSCDTNRTHGTVFVLKFDSCCAGYDFAHIEFPTSVTGEIKLLQGYEVR